MTPRQQKLLAYLTDYMGKNNGIAPTYDEMRVAMNLKSKSNIQPLLDNLEERGLIVRYPGRARSIEVVMTADGCCPTCGKAY